MVRNRLVYMKTLTSLYENLDQFIWFMETLDQFKPRPVYMKTLLRHLASVWPILG
jgi:hypothetical protein